MIPGMNQAPVGAATKMSHAGKNDNSMKFNDKSSDEKSFEGVLQQQTTRHGSETNKAEGGKELQSHGKAMPAADEGAADGKADPKTAETKTASSPQSTDDSPNLNAPAGAETLAQATSNADAAALDGVTTVAGEEQFVLSLTDGTAEQAVVGRQIASQAVAEAAQRVTPAQERLAEVSAKLAAATDASKVAVPDNLQSSMTGLTSPDLPVGVAQAQSLRTAMGESIAQQNTREIPLDIAAAADLRAIKTEIGEQLKAVQQALAAAAPQSGEAGEDAGLSQPKSTTSSAVLPLASGVMPESASLSGAKSGFNSVMVASPASSQWGQEFANKVTFFVRQGAQEASVQLTPPDLGRIEIKVSTDGDQARMSFTVQNAVAREAIEQAMPRLREMLEQGGLQLAHSDVADHSQPQQQERTPDELNSVNAAGGGADIASEQGQTVTVQVSNSLVDYYI